ncbi:DUF4468 domain-containing protein [Xylanibacter caecicola]|uniref:DUF4468 domain-containing protein n=1 Tax=Xylanibacter caecicola TaxID=2736294 RepID=UPI002596C884|nr:DUF4468 domain-containing protein [Xylanibacter caecicola]
MKRILLCIVLSLIIVYADAQVMRTEELEKYAVEKYGENWQEAALNLVKELQLDKNNSLTYTQVIDCGNQTKDRLYIILNHWFTETFNDANAVIKLNERDLGCIIGQGFVPEIAEHIGGINSYVVNIRPIIKVDIKDKKIRVTYTVQYYDVTKENGGGFIGAMGGTVPMRSDEKWMLETCFPFVAKDGHRAKKTSSKALVMTHAYSNVIMDKIEEAVKNGLVGNENDDW